MSTQESAPQAGGIRAAACALALFCAALCTGTQGHGFPFFYHPDEPDKVDQLITGKWNFHHPLLMLGTAQLARMALHVPDREQALVLVGRWCSAAFAAGGVAALALLGLRTRGWAGFWLTGLLLLTQHQVYELAHYFKEDTALFCAMALGFLALHVHHRRPGAGPALAVGAACGLALSAKYLGAVMIVPVAFIMAAAQRAGRAKAGQWGAFAAGLLGVAVAVNFRILLHLDVFTHSFGRETALLERGERGYTGGQVALFEYLHMFLNNTTPMVWLLVPAELWALRKRRDAFEWIMGVFPFAFALLLSCSAKTNDRYFLPATAGFYYLTALGAIDLGELLGGKAARWAPALCGSLAVMANIVWLMPYVNSFAHDDRAELQAWIRANVPANAVIAAEIHADLPVERRKERLAVQPLLSQTVIETKYAADLGATPADLAAQGIGYAVISESDYGIFFRKAAEEHLAPVLREKRAFYEKLRSTLKPVWERPRGTGIYLHPGLEVYRLAPPG